MRNGGSELLALFAENIDVWCCRMVELARESASVDCTMDFVSFPLLCKSYQELRGVNQQSCVTH